MQVRFVVPQLPAQVMMARQSVLPMQVVSCVAQLVVAQMAQLTAVDVDVDVDVEFAPPLPGVPPVAFAPPMVRAPPVLLTVVAPPAPPVPGLLPESLLLLLHPNAAAANREDIPRVLNNGMGTSDESITKNTLLCPYDNN
jgi:hypothetical protein